jgi:hypothetical protein
MNIYRVQPKDKHSFSRRWFVDDVGFELVKQKYTLYGREYEEKVNRWDEFKYELVNNIWFDFGGMMHKDTPQVKEVVCGVEIDILVTHVDMLLAALSSTRLLSPTYWQCGTRYNNYIFSLDFLKELKKVFKDKEKEHQKLCTEFFDMIDSRIKKSKENV